MESNPQAILPTTRVTSASIEFVQQPFIKPLQLSSGVITSITEARATVHVEVGGISGTGCGSIYLSDLWAWPDPSRSHEERDEVLRAHTNEIARALPHWCEGPAHPLELGLRLHHKASPHPLLPALATSMAASPFDAAIHDAAGQALGLSAFSFYEQDFPSSADAYFGGTPASAAIRRLILHPAAEMLPGWYLLGAGDELAQSIPAGISLGYSRFKVKIPGKDPQADAARTVETFRIAVSQGVNAPVLSLDSNEGNPDAQSVLDYLAELRGIEPAAFEALAYLEQPTGRDITLHAFDWREVASIKPVYLDEGLTSLDLLPQAKEQGWSGLALKTCKGHSFALCAAAWAQTNGMTLAIQDLTNPGLSAIHSYLFAAHLPTQNGIELNSRQYTPDANKPWLPRLNSLFLPADGTHRLPDPQTPGLGSSL